MRASFDLQGHRFARGLFPENTLEGFDAACALGLASFEIDIAVTSDGIPVLHHDPALNPDTTRGPDGAWLTGTGPLIRDLTLSDLSRYDVGRLRPGSAYAARYPSQAAADGARIPTLESVLRRRPGVRFNIELKLISGQTVAPEIMTDAVLLVVDATEAADRITIQSFDWRAPRYVSRTRPDIPRGWLSEANPAATTIDAIAAEGGGTWSPFHADLSQAHIDRAQQLGLRVVPWTVNEPADMRRLIAWSVDGLITDRPDRAMALDPAPG